MATLRKFPIEQRRTFSLVLIERNESQHLRLRERERRDIDSSPTRRTSPGSLVSEIWQPWYWERSLLYELAGAKFRNAGSAKHLFP
jgi:hypothetical protein